MPPKAILFDIGNVLLSFDYARTFPSLAAKTPRSFAEVHGHLSGMSGDLESGRLTSEDFIASAVEFLGGGVTPEEFHESFTGIFQPIAPVWELVERVRRRVPVYLFSNTSEIHEAHIFRHFPQFSVFTGGFYSWRLGAMKPEPGMYQAALTTLGLRGQEIAYVDDLPANIETGRGFGFHSLQYDRSRHHELEQFLDQCGLLAGPQNARQTQAPTANDGASANTGAE